MVSLQRFIDAQEGVFQTALTEVMNGRKQSHWMWFIFPQIQGLGFSNTSKYYAIRDLSEAAAYLNHPILGGRLIQICNALLRLNSCDAYEIFGSPDDQKLQSSVSLFSLVPGTAPVFQAVLNKFFRGAKDPHTLHIVSYQP